MTSRGAVSSTRVQVSDDDAKRLSAAPRSLAGGRSGRRRERLCPGPAPRAGVCPRAEEDGRDEQVRALRVQEEPQGGGGGAAASEAGGVARLPRDARRSPG